MTLFMLTVYSACIKTGTLLHNYIFFLSAFNTTVICKTSAVCFYCSILTIKLFVASRCDILDVLIEMDRILRPEGAVLVRDEVDVLNKVMLITQGMRWECRMADHEDGPFVREKIMVCVKTYWVGVALNTTTSS